MAPVGLLVLVLAAQLGHAHAVGIAVGALHPGARARCRRVMGEDSGFDPVDHRLEGLADVRQHVGRDRVPETLEATPCRDEPVLGPHRRLGRSVEQAGRLAVDGQLQQLSLGVGIVLAQPR